MRYRRRSTRPTYVGNKGERKMWLTQESEKGHGGEEGKNGDVGRTGPDTEDQFRQQNQRPTPHKPCARAPLSSPCSNYLCGTRNLLVNPSIMALLLFPSRYSLPKAPNPSQACHPGGGRKSSPTPSCKETRDWHAYINQF